jgi:hypothetical protein
MKSFLGEEEISDVSLSTFYVFDKENAAQPQLGEKVAAWAADVVAAAAAVADAAGEAAGAVAAVEAAAGPGVIAASVRAKSLPT